ncbi:MAG: hypothetical protein K2Y20_03895 [Sphingomonas sp.]|nr:hypothetical protein [Sphingomonas sp.]
MIFETPDGIEEYRHLGLKKMVGADIKDAVVTHFKLGGEKIFVRIVRLGP